MCNPVTNDRADRSIIVWEGSNPEEVRQRRTEKLFEPRAWSGARDGHSVFLKLAFMFASRLLDPQCCMGNFQSLSYAHGLDMALFLFTLMKERFHTHRVASEIVFQPLHPDSGAPLLEERVTFWILPSRCHRWNAVEDSCRRGLIACSRGDGGAR